MKVKCLNKECKYEWDYKGKSKFYITCPQCHRNFKIKDNERRLKTNVKI